MQRVNNGKSMCILSLGPTSGYITHTLVSDSVATWTVAHQASLSMEFSRQEYWSVLPFPSLGDIPSPGMGPVSLASPAMAGGFFTTAPSGKPKGHQNSETLVAVWKDGWFPWTDGFYSLLCSYNPSPLRE